MASEPLNSRTLIHKLNFISGGHGVIEIDEPINFDGANFVVMQEDKRYGRDVSFAGEEVDFTFYNQEQVIGNVFPRLVEYYQRYGFESEVQYILSEGDVDYVVGTLDFETAETDLLLYFSCKVIQETNQAIIKRRKDVKIDLFSDIDLDENAIEPVSTSRILFKAKPVARESEWQDRQPFWAYTGNFNTGTGFHVLNQNPLAILTATGIRNSLSFLENILPTFAGSPTFLADFYNFPYIDAIDDLSDVFINVKDLALSYFIQVGVDFNDPSALPFPLTGEVEFRLRWYLFPIGDDGQNALDSGSENIPYTLEFIGTENIDRFNSANLSGNADRYDLSFEDYEFTIPSIPRGHRLAMCFFVGRSFTLVEWLDGAINIQSKATAIDTVVEGVRLIDAMRQVVKSINPTFNFSAPRFDVGGEWYDNFVFDGNRIRGLQRAYIMSFKDITEHLQEFNCDYQIDDNSISFEKYDDFYADDEIAVYDIAPNETFKSNFNPRYSIISLLFNYKTFDQDEDDDDTIDAVHTNTELFFRNRNVENVKEISLPFIRDVFMGETTRIKGISTKPTTSLSQDDKTFIYDVVPLPINSTKVYSDIFSHGVNTDGQLRLLNNGFFDWGVLGFNVGATFDILTTQNAGTYIVNQITQNILTLDPVSANPVNLDQVLTRIEYPLSDVILQIRTNEGFAQVENIVAPEDYANLAYTPKRNILNNWHPYISTANKYRNQNVRVQYHKNGGDLITRLESETVAIQENEPITTFTNAILDPIILTTKVIADFTSFWQLQDRLKERKGYVTINDNTGRSRKIHPMKLDFSWADNLLEITGELRKESLILNITKTDDTYTLSRDGYVDITSTVLDWDSENGYIEFIGQNSLSLTERIRFDLVSVNGTTYDSIVDLLTALQAL